MTREEMTNKIAILHNDIAVKQNELDNFEIEEDDDIYDAFLDNACPDYRIGYLTFSASQVLKELDPTAYRCGKSEYFSDLDPTEDDGYIAIQDKIDDLTAELEELQSELEDEEV